VREEQEKRDKAAREAALRAMPSASEVRKMCLLSLSQRKQQQQEQPHTHTHTETLLLTRSQTSAFNPFNEPDPAPPSAPPAAAAVAAPASEQAAAAAAAAAAAPPEPEPEPEALPFNPFASIVAASPKASPQFTRKPLEPEPPAPAPIALPPISLPISLPPLSLPIPTQSSLNHVEAPVPNASALASMFGGQKSYALGPSLHFQFEAVAPQQDGLAYQPAVAKFGGPAGPAGSTPGTAAAAAGPGSKPASNPFAGQTARSMSTASALKKPGTTKGGPPAKRAPPTREGYLEKIISGKGK
jgi:hypothetical protein